MSARGLLERLHHAGNRPLDELHLLLGEQELVVEEADAGDDLLLGPPHHLDLLGLIAARRAGAQEGRGPEERLLERHIRVPRVLGAELHLEELPLGGVRIEEDRGNERDGRRYVACVRPAHVDAGVDRRPRLRDLPAGDRELEARLLDLAAPLDRHPERLVEGEREHPGASRPAVASGLARRRPRLRLERDRLRRKHGDRRRHLHE